MDSGLGIAVLAQIVSELLQLAFYFMRTKPIRITCFEDISDIVCERQILKEVCRISTGRNCYAFTFGKRFQGLERLANQHNSFPMLFLLRQQIGKLLLGFFVSPSIIKG